MRYSSLLEILSPPLDLVAISWVYSFFIPPGLFFPCQTEKCYCSLELFPQPTSVLEFSLGEYSHSVSQLQSEVFTGIQRLVTAKQQPLVHQLLTFSHTSRFLPYISMVSSTGTSRSSCPEFNATFFIYCCVFCLIFGSKEYPAIQARKPRDESSLFTHLQIMTQTC